VRFNSTTGGFFDVELAASAQTVSDQIDANIFASRLDAASSTLSFYQTREISSFTGTGNLVGALAEVQLKDFSDVEISNFSATASPSAG
jgi:hypothetical protein